jgi:4'-phosphopantetheinyl transferase
MWRYPQEPLAWSNGELHVWRASLAIDDDLLEFLHQILSNDERERAAKFHFERDRRRFVAAHGTLRRILARYVVLEPPRLQFTCNAFGKPELIPTAGIGPLMFNLSHSHEIAVCAVTTGCEVGIDVEYAHSLVGDLRIARQFFSPFEVAQLMRLAGHEQRRAFLTCWTRKEAYIKARGQGLSIPLDQFDVSLIPGEPAALIATRDESDLVADWNLCDLDLGPDYVGALAYAGPARAVNYWDWRP